MVLYYIFLVALGIFGAVFLFVGTLAVVQHRRQSLEQQSNKAHQDLLKKESKTGSSELNASMYSKISNEMLRDIAESEGFRFIEESQGYLSLQRTIAQNRDERASPSVDGKPIHARGDFGEKRQRESLQQTLSTAGDTDSLTLRRDELGALPKAEILRTAQEHGWEYRSEEISGNEWQLVFHRGSRAVEA